MAQSPVTPDSPSPPTLNSPTSPTQLACENQTTTNIPDHNGKNGESELSKISPHGIGRTLGSVTSYGADGSPIHIPGKCNFSVNLLTRTQE